MMQNILGRFPQNMIIICAGLTMVLPYLFSKLNSKLGKLVNPSWKKNDEK